MEMDSRLARTSRPLGTVEICKINATCRLFSLSFYCWFSGHFSLTATHATAVTFPSNFVLLQIFSPKFHKGANASEISYLELLTTSPNPGNWLNRAATDENTILGKLTVSQSSEKESKACIYRIEKIHRNTHSVKCCKFPGHQAYRTKGRIWYAPRGKDAV